MNELNSIQASLKALEKVLYGRNYEVHFQFETVAESTDLATAITELGKKYNRTEWQPDEFVSIPFSGFSKIATEHFNYKGNNSHGPLFTKPKLEEFEKLNTKLWQVIGQKFIPGHTVIYSIPALQTWIYWNFCFLIVSKDRNKIYLFEGGASD